MYNNQIINKKVENKPIINLYLKEMSKFNMKKKVFLFIIIILLDLILIVILIN